jgi:hypothetical protein
MGESEKLSPIQSYINDLEHFITGNNFWQVSQVKQLDGLDHKHALFRPSPDRHCIWELVRHINYWKYWALSYFNEGVALDAKQDNWAPLPEEQNEEAWQADVNKLKSLHKQCLAAAEKIGDDLFRSTDKKIVFFRQLLYHDCYHTGQIGLLRVLQGLKPLDT